MPAKSCPVCGAEAPKFCPRDGSRVGPGELCATARAQAAAAPAVETDATLIETPAIRPEGGAHGWLDDQASRRQAAAGPTAVDERAAAVTPRPPGSRQAPPRAAAPPERKLSPEQLARLAAASRDEAARSGRPSRGGATAHATESAPDPARPAQKREAAQKREPAQGKPAEGAPEGGFSETQWFMKGIQVDADLLETVDESEYKRDTSIPESDRKKFTLRKDEE